MRFLNSLTTWNLLEIDPNHKKTEALLKETSAFYLLLGNLSLSNPYGVHEFLKNASQRIRGNLKVSGQSG
jgi:hypothetical protein